MQPVRRVMNATHFKQVQEVDDDGMARTRYMPCSPGDPDAREMTWMDVESDELREPHLVMNDFLKALHAVRPSVSAADIQKHLDFMRESGAE